MTTNDIRSVIAKDRDGWFESEEGIGCLQGVTGGQYLRNRLDLAFLAGYEKAAKRAMEISTKHERKIFDCVGNPMIKKFEPAIANEIAKELSVIA